MSSDAYAAALGLKPAKTPLAAGAALLTPAEDAASNAMERSMGDAGFDAAYAKASPADRADLMRSRMMSVDPANPYAMALGVAPKPASATPRTTSPVPAPAPASPGATSVAAPAAPSLLDRAGGVVQAGMHVAADTIDSLGGYVGSIGGSLGGLAGALQTKLSGGVQPDDPRVLAVTGDNRPRTWASGESPQPVTALDEARDQGAQTAVSALHSGPSIQLTNPQGRAYADTIEGGLQTLANAYPMGPTPEMNAAAASLPAAVATVRASPVVQSMGKAKLSSLVKPLAAPAPQLRIEPTMPGQLPAPPLAVAQPELARGVAVDPAPGSMASQPPTSPVAEQSSPANLELAPQEPIAGRSAPFPSSETPAGAPAATPGIAPAPETAPSYLDPELQVPAPLPPPQLQHASPELQQAIAKTQASGTPINPDVVQRHVEADTLPVPIRLTAGQATLDPTAISLEKNSRGAVQPLVSPDFYNQQYKALAENMDVIRQNAAPDVTATDPTQHGQVLIDQYKAMDAAAQADISAKYQALKDANGGNFPVDGSAFAQQAQAALKADNVQRFLPPQIQGIVEDAGAGGQMTYNDFENFRTILAKAARAPTLDGNSVHAVNVVRNALESLPMADEAAAVKPLADAARQAAKARFDAIDADPAYKAAINDGVKPGEASPEADDFVKNYLIGAPRANILQMRRNLAGSPIAQQTIPAATVDYLSGKAKADVETGKFNAASYNGVVDKLKPKFDALVDPASAATLQQVGNVAKYTTVQPGGSFVNNSNTLVGMGWDVAKNRVGDAINTASYGATGTIAGIAKGLKQAKAAKAATAPGAGITKFSDLAGRKPPE